MRRLATALRTPDKTWPEGTPLADLPKALRDEAAEAGAVTDQAHAPATPDKPRDPIPPYITSGIRQRTTYFDEGALLADLPAKLQTFALEQGIVAGDLEPQEPEPTFDLSPLQGSVSKALKPALAQIADLDHLSALLAAELEGKNRGTAKAAIDDRQSEIGARPAE